MPYQARDGDIIALDNPKAGSLVMSTSLANYEPTSTDPIGMFARRDAYRTVAEAIASGMAGVPLNLYQRDEENGRKKLAPEDHAIAAALETPQPHLSQFRWIEALQLDAVLWDRWACFVELQDDGSYQFHRLPARRISFALDAFGRITDVAVWGSNAEPHLIPATSCLFDVGYDPQFGGAYTKGYPISRTLGPSATELDAGAKYRAALLAGGPKVPMYIKRPANAPDWIRNGGRDRFKEEFAGYSAEKAGQVPVLEDGMELVDAPQLNPQNVEYIEARKAAQIEFAIAMHYPPELIGYREGTLSNVEAYREQLYVDVLGGRITAFRQALNLGLRAGGYITRDLYVEENLAVRLASSPEKQAAVLQTQVGAPIRTVNEARRMQNLPPVDGGDELIVPLNVVRGGLASPTDTGPKVLEATAARSGATMKALTARAAASSAEFKAAVDAQRDRFAGDLSKAFKRQADRVTSVLGTASSPGPLADAFVLEREDAELASIIYPHTYALAVSGAAGVLAKFNPDSDGFDPEVMQAWLAKASTGAAHQINSASFQKLSEAIFSGEGWTKAVSDLFDHLAGASANLWATTLATTSTSFGSADAAKASGVTRKTWRDSGGKGGRASHAALNGETVDAWELFSNGMRWPGDPAGGATENAGCHCHVEWSRAD